MAKEIERLNALQVTRAKKRGYYADGAGLYLQVAAGGSKTWVLRYTRDKRTRDMGLGSLSVFTLAEARERAREARKLLADKIDPIEARQEVQRERRRAEARALLFNDAADRYIAAHESGWKNAKHAAQWQSTIATYAAPIIGSMDVATIATDEIMRVLTPIWTAKNETAARLRGRLEMILDWCRVQGFRVGDNPARWKGHLEALLPARSKVSKAKHFAALPWRDMKPFMAELRKQNGIGALALQFTILTAARSGEVRGMEWYEVDFEQRLWTVPGVRMKAGREHRVPLSNAAVELLEQLKAVKLADTETVFPSVRDHKPLSDMTLTAVLRRMQRSDITVHGFRSSFRDWAAEATDYPQEMAEMALAHIVGNKVEAAYRRGDMLEKRRAMMEAWASFIL